MNAIPVHFNCSRKTRVLTRIVFAYGKTDARFSTCALPGTGLTDTFEKRLEAIAANTDVDFAGGRKGIEKESLRIAPDGFLSEAGHPRRLGSALTNRYITTDFSEALLEFVRD